MSNNNNTPPPWSDAPPWANWRAQDKDGSWFWYKVEPFPGKKLAWWGLDTTGNKTQIAKNKTDNSENPKWRDTLQKRPKDE